MKNILLLLLVGISLSAFSQKKIKFNKDIFPLLESKDFATATPLLLDFVKSNPNNTKANYWAGAIFYGRVAAFDKQLSTGELLLTQLSIDAIDSSILFLSTCKKWLSAATLNLFNAKYYPDFTGNTTEELLADGINDLGRWINLLDGYKTDWEKYKLYSKEEITELREKELAQKYNGKYFNSVDQTLIIYNQDDQDFDFQVSWGVNDEWGCFFTASGTAKFTSGTEAYYGIDAEWPEIKFFFGEGFDVSVEGGLDFMGDDCASFGDSGSDKYTSFKKLKYGNVSIDQVNEFVASFYNSLELTDEENQRHFETGEVQFNINNFNQLINSDSKFSTKRVDQYLIVLSTSSKKFEL